jgi:hypothetical protein
MNKKMILSLALAVSFLANPAFATKPSNPGFTLPSNAVEVSPNIYSLGKAYDSATHELVDGYAIVHKKNDAKTSGASNNAKNLSCYGFIASGAKWKVSPEPWRVTSAGATLDGIFLLNNIGANISKWESAITGTHDILGIGTLVSTSPTNKNVLDNVNEVSFGPITDSNTIAVTTVWGNFGGPTFNRQIVEWDQVFNSAYSWSSNGEAGKMDFNNISTHELGHAVGMGDIYQSGCGSVTMYGYASVGDTNKQTLEIQDITGINELY